MGHRWVGPLDRLRTTNPYDEETVFQVLRNRRRRYVLHLLKQEEGVVPVGRVAEQVAAWENDKEVAAVTPTERKRVYISLIQSHLPTLTDANMVVFDEEASTVRLTDDAEAIDVYVELAPENDIRWPQYYLGLCAFAGAFLVAVWYDVAPLTEAPDVAWFGFVVVLFGLSSVVHHLHASQLRLGTEGPPPE
jgi:DNA-binding transcriptional ArsR family regulator